jgi:hypothetical protein
MEDSSKVKNAEAISKLFTDKEEQSLEQNILTKSGKKIPVIDTANYANIDGEEYLIEKNGCQLKDTKNGMELFISTYI